MIETKISSPSYILIVLLGYITLRYIYKPAANHNQQLASSRKNFGIFIILIISLFAVQDTDYYHYKTALYEMSQGQMLHFEDIYYKIGELVNYNYLLFRFVVWGSALGVFLATVKRLNVPTSMVLFFFVTMYLTKFSYARASLAMAIGLFGFSFVIKPIRMRCFSYILGTSLILISLSFHKSAIFMIPIYSLSLFRFNKHLLWVLILLFPLGYYLISEYGIELLMGAENDDMIISSAQGYLMKSSHKKGIAVLMLHFLSRMPYYIFLYVILSDIQAHLNETLPKYQRAMINIPIYVIYLASLFLFNYSVSTEVLYYRFLYYSILPLSIIIPLLFDMKKHYRLLRISCMMGFCAVIYEILYSFYIAYLSA